MRLMLILMSLSVTMMVSCGQEPSFSDQSQGILNSSTTSQANDTTTGGSSPVPSTGDAVASSGAGQSGGGGGTTLPPSSGSNSSLPPGSSGGGTTSTEPTFHTKPSDSSSPVFTVPGATTAEVEQISSCLQKWGQVPFSGAISVRRIYATVTVGGFGVGINDITQTPGPALILVDAGVNVGGSPVFNMLNNNGFYCMKVNVNVNTSFTVNLACNARLADNSVQVNVGSNASGTTSGIGVNVGSNVTVRSMTPSGGSCQ
jgi:hypothetical protein